MAGWVEKSKVRIFSPGHPLERSTPNFKDISIHRLYSSARVWVSWWGSGGVMGILGSDVIHLNQVRFGYGHREGKRNSGTDWKTSPKGPTGHSSPIGTSRAQ